MKHWIWGILGAFLVLDSAAGQSPKPCMRDLQLRSKEGQIEVLSLVRDGNVDAFESLERSFSPIVMRWLTTHGLGYQDAEDCTQMVFLGLWNGRAKIKPEQNPFNLLITIAQRRRYDLLHTQNSPRRISPLAFADLAPDDVAEGGLGILGVDLQPGTDLENSEEVSKLTTTLQAALSNLRATEARAILLRLFGDGREDSEVAASAGISTSAFQTALSRARANLSQRLAQERSIEQGYFQLIPDLIQENP